MSKKNCRSCKNTLIKDYCFECFCIQKKCVNCDKLLTLDDDPTCEDCGAIVPSKYRKFRLSYYFCTNCYSRLDNRDSVCRCGCSNKYRTNENIEFQCPKCKKLNHYFDSICECGCEEYMTPLIKI